MLSKALLPCLPEVPSETEPRVSDVAVMSWPLTDPALNFSPFPLSSWFFPGITTQTVHSSHTKFPFSRLKNGRMSILSYDSVCTEILILGLCLVGKPNSQGMKFVCAKCGGGSCLGRDTGNIKVKITYCILTGGLSYTQVFTVEDYPMIHLKFVHVIICKFYLKRKKEILS